MKGAVILCALLVVHLVLADLPSCERARCTHCESQFVARLCTDVCRQCFTTKANSRRPSVRGEPIAETGVVQSGLSSLHVISQQTNNAPVNPQGQESVQASPPHAAQLPSALPPNQIFQQRQYQQPAPTQISLPQQQVQPQPQLIQAQPPVVQQQPQLFSQPPQAPIQAPQPQYLQPQPQPFYPFQYQTPAFGAPLGTQQSFFFNPFQPFLPYAATSLPFAGQTSLLPPTTFPGFQPTTIVPANTNFGQVAPASSAASASGAQQSQIPPSPPPPANLIDTQSYQYQKSAQLAGQAATSRTSYQQAGSINKEQAAVQPQQAYNSLTKVRPSQTQQGSQTSNNVEPSNSVKSTLASIKTTTAPPLQCPSQPNWQPCITKDLANERFRSCCQRLGEGCVSLCSYDQNLATIQIAVLTGRCPISKVAAMMICASGYEDATPCCQAYGVFEPGFEHCKPYCNPAAGLPQGGMLTEQYKCLGKLSQIQHCFYVTQRP
uniref:DB domain-containing protein n=1 Tax=Steinernema glaseri TaxID=37863 RepID=A0A1I8AS33_9BILA